MRTGRTSRSWNSVPMEWMAAVVVLIILAILAAMVFFKDRSAPPIVESEFPFRFVGVRPNAGDAIYDARGDFLRNEIYGLSDLTPWPTNKLRRNFIFEFASTNVGEVFPRFSYQLPGQPDRPVLVVRSAHVYRLRNGTVRVEVPVELPSTYTRPLFYFFPRRKTIAQVDLDLTLYVEKARDQQGVMHGPFVSPREIVLSDLTKFHVSFGAANDPAVTEIICTLTSPSHRPTDPSHDIILVRNAKGETVSTGERRINTQGRTRVIISRYPDLKLSEISEIVVLKAQRIRVPGVHVDYPNVPHRYFPASLERVLSTLGLPNPTPNAAPSTLSLREYVQDETTAVKLLALVRGSLIHQLQNILIPLVSDRDNAAGFASWHESDVTRLRDTAAIWARAVHPQVQFSGVALGLTVGWSEFVSPAMSILNTDGSPYAGPTARLLRDSAALLSSEHIREIQRLILRSEDSFLIGRMAECLASNATESADVALRELTADVRPWVWFHAAHACPLSFWQTESNLPPEADKHLILTHGPLPKASPSHIRDAYAELPAILTADLRMRYPHIFMILVKDRVLSPPMDKAMGTKFIVDHLREYAWPDRESFITWTMIQRLNEWHGTTFGRSYLSPEPGGLPVLGEVPWAELVREVSAWYENNGDR